jgi:hypothetical protein
MKRFVLRRGGHFTALPLVQITSLSAFTAALQLM